LSEVEVPLIATVIVSDGQLSRPVNQKLFRLRLPSHMAINIPQEEMECISFPSVARCARCGEDS
jgi:hypothetical protein